MRDRQYNMDYLRITACFMVILLHASAQNWHVTDVNSMEWKVFNFYDTAVRSAVPLFLMLSGKLMLSRNTELSIKSLYKKNILKLVVVYFAWSLFYAIDTIGISKVLDGEIGALITKVIDAKYHLWYLPALISIYFLVPVFHSLVKYKEGMYVPYACVMFIIFGIGQKLAYMLFPGSESIRIIFSDFNYALHGLSGYFLMGYALDKYRSRFAKIKMPYLLGGLLLIIVAAAKIGELDAVAAGEPKSLLYGHFTLPVFLETVIIFMIFLRLPEKLHNTKAAAIVGKLSKYTLFVYLVHVFALEHLKSWFGVTTMSFYPWISVPALALFVFVICMLAAWIMDKVPVVNKWLM